MKRITRVRRCVHLPANAKGRDFVVGDLHGQRARFGDELERLGFDPRKDRVFSVGDLVDRGPDSLGTLALIEEPWFHAVLGNHELALLQHLGCCAGRIHAQRPVASRGNEWLADAMATRRKTLERLAERVAALPMAIHVDGTVPFVVVHGDLEPLGGRLEALDRDHSVGIHAADLVASSRANLEDAVRLPMLELGFAHHPVWVSDTPAGELPITYAGHTPTRHITVHRSYVHIEQAVRSARTSLAQHQGPTVLDHARFAWWLGGVTHVRREAQAA